MKMTTSSHLNEPDYWRERAEELRSIASGINDDKAKATILSCARDYDRLAERAEERVRSGQ